MIPWSQLKICMKFDCIVSDRWQGKWYWVMEFGGGVHTTDMKDIFQIPCIKDIRGHREI